MSDDDVTRGQRESDAFNARGIEAADRKWYDEAVRAFQKAIELDATSAHAHDNLATVYAEQQQYLLALENYIAALRLEPDNPTTHYNLACFLTGHGHAMAVSEYQEAIRLEHDYPDAHVNLGLCFADAGDHASAIREFRVAVDLDPGDLGAKQELAASLIDVGEFAEAIRHLKDVVRIEPGNVDAHIDLGIAYTEQGFYAEAERTYRAGIDAAPREVLLRYHLASLYAAWGKAEDALKALETAAALDKERVVEWADGDRAFDALRGEAEFTRILG
jgi:tetratricopeptide (TPR) repeat protein